MKKTNDLTPFTNILPYSSEIFGVYQPLLGWRSKRMRGRMERGFANDTLRHFDALRGKFKGRFQIALDEGGRLSEIAQLEPARLATFEHRFAGSFVAES